MGMGVVVPNAVPLVAEQVVAVGHVEKRDMLHSRMPSTAIGYVFTGEVAPA
jgi:hypothetical protein